MASHDHPALAAVMGFLASYARGDVNGCLAQLSTSAPVLLFGTNDNEVFHGVDAVRAALARDFATMADIRWGERRNTHVSAAGELASVLVELPISYRSGGHKVETLVRYALTLADEAGTWRIRCGLTSVPFASGTYDFSR